MQNEDNIRGLAKTMEFMRAISILFVVIDCYWYCYEASKIWSFTIGVVDKILWNFQYYRFGYGRIKSPPDLKHLVKNKRLDVDF